jgi:hypothetical protein
MTRQGTTRSPSERTGFLARPLPPGSRYLEDVTEQYPARLTGASSDAALHQSAAWRRYASLEHGYTGQYHL